MVHPCTQAVYGQNIVYVDRKAQKEVLGSALPLDERRIMDINLDIYIHGRCALNGYFSFVFFGFNSKGNGYKDFAYHKGLPSTHVDTPCPHCGKRNK